MINEYLNKVIKSICNIDINQLIVDMSIKKQEVSCLKGELTHFKQENYSKSAQIVQLESEINNQKDEINTLKRHNVELLSILDSNKADINSLQNERNNLFSDIANKLRIINEQILQNTNLQEQLNQTISALQSSKQENTRLQEYTIQMRNKCSELGQNIQSVSDEKDTLSSNIAELQSQIADKNSEIERLKEKDNQASVINKELLRKQTNLHEEISSIRAEKDTLLQQLEEKRIRSEQEQEEYKQTIESLLSEKLALITQVDTLQNNIADYKSKVETFEEDNNQLPVSNEELLPNQTLLQDENSIVYEEKDSPLQQVEEEIQINTQMEESCQTVELISTEEDSPKTESIYQNSVENNNDIIEDKQEETTIKTNTIDEDDIEIVNVEPIISTDIEVDSNDVKEENPDFLEHTVADESSAHSLYVTTDEDIDETATSRIETETEDKQTDASTDATMMHETEEDEDELDDDFLPYFYDNSLVPADKLSIPEVYDVKEEKIINSRDFFSQNESELILWRRNLQEEYLMGHARFICPECKQPVKISGHKLARGRVCYFAHFKDSDDCSYKTGTHRTKEEIEKLKYSLVQESDRHKRLKSAIASALKGERSISVKNVECEKRIKSDIPYLNWRRPDIYAEYNGRKFVFELQLSTTFVSVIVDRDIFYRLNDYNIIWVFNFEDNAEYVNLHNLMCKDIYYANKRNVFIFDTDAEERSKEKGELVLKCRWLDKNGQWSNDQYVTLDMFQYDEENCKPFIVDADKAYLEKYPEYVARRKQLEHSREYFLRTLMERQKREEELEERKKEECSKLQLEILNDNKSVTRFRSGTKYGYQYEGTTILPAKYTSAEDFHDNRYAQVGFNKKVGLVRKDGKEVVPVEYKTVKIVDEKYSLLLGLYKKIHLWFGDEMFDLVYEYNDKEQDIITEQDGDKIEYICRSKKYSYYYTGRYYEGYPIRRKSHDGYDCFTLFTFLKEKDCCTLWVGNKVYMMSKNGDFLIKGQYSDIKLIGIEQIFIVKDYNTKLWGVIDLEGNVIADFKYSLLVPTNSEYLIAEYEKTPGLLGLIDYLNREYFAPKFNSLFYLSSEYFAFRENGLWGICDRFGQIIHRAEYTYIRSEMSGSLRASTLNFHKNKWEYVIGVYSPRYFDENEKLCLLDKNGEISYREQIRGNYIIRCSGDLFSIYSLNNDQLVDYCLLSVSFITDTLAIIKNIEGEHGFYYDDQCHYVENCIRISHLFNDIYTFEDKSNQFAIGNHFGPISKYLFSSISIIDSSHFKVLKKEYNYYNWPNEKYRYYITNELGEVLSVEFTYIGTFQNGIAEATYNGRQGIINSQGEMQEKIVASYGEYSIYEKFEHLYFKNFAKEIVSEECQSIKPLCQSFFSIKSCSNNYVRIFSLEECLPSDKYFESIELFTDKLFVVKELIEYKNPYRLYKGISPFINESFSTVKLLENGYIAFQKRIDSSYTAKYIWKIVNTEGDFLTNREIDSITTVTSDSFEVVIEGNSGKIDLNGNDIIEKSEFHEDSILTKCFGNYGLEDKKGNVLLSLDQKFTDIVLLNSSYIKVCKDSKYALFSIAGKRITNHKYSDISIHEDGGIYAIRNNHTGRLDIDGKEIPELEAFDGGYLHSCFGEYSILDESKEKIIFAGYSQIELLDNEGVFALWKDDTIALGNKQKEITGFDYKSVKAIGSGLFIISKTITKNKRIRNTGYNHWGNPYTYYTSHKVLEEKFGIIDKNLKTIIPCKYKSISGFDSNNKLEAKDNNGTSKIFSLTALNQKSTDTVGLTAEMEYQARVKGFMPIGLVVKINASAYIIHKKYLYKSKSKFTKGEIFIVKYLSNDKDGHPVWETNSCAQEPVEELTENKN